MLRLLIETPAAGFVGQQFIAADSRWLGDLSITQRWHTGLEGNDFLAAEWPVEQRLATQTVRSDHERLVLVGVDTQRMSAGERAAVQKALLDLRPAVRRLVDDIDWSRRGHGHVTDYPEMAEWLEGTAFAHVPVVPFVEQTLPRKAGSAHDRRYPSRAVLLTLSAVLAMVIGVWFLRTPPTPSPQPSPPTKGERFTEVARRFGCSEDELQRWLTEENGTDPSGNALIDPKLLDCLENGNGVERFLCLCDVPDSHAKAFRDFLGTLRTSTPAQVVRIRTALLTAHQRFVELRGAATRANALPAWEAHLADDSSFRLTDDEKAFLRALVSIHEITDSGCAAGTRIVGPFFRQQDVCRFRDLIAVFSDSRRAGFESVAGIKYESLNDATRFREALASVANTQGLKDRVDRPRSYAHSKTGSDAFVDLGGAFISFCEVLNDPALR